MQFTLPFNVKPATPTQHFTPGTLLVQDLHGPRPASQGEILVAAREAVTSYTVRGQKMNTPAAVRDFLQVRLNASLQHEVVGVIYLTAQHELIAYDEPFRGTITQAAVYPREIVKAALAHNAAAVIIAHNHPSGQAEPSRSDVTLTKQLREALALVEVRLLDHIIVAGKDTVSLAERALL